MSGDIAAVVNRGENLPAILGYIMKVRYAKVLSTKDPEKKHHLADSYNFKARMMNEFYGLSLPYVNMHQN